MLLDPTDTERTERERERQRETRALFAFVNGGRARCSRRCVRATATVDVHVQHAPAEPSLTRLHVGARASSSSGGQLSKGELRPRQGQWPRQPAASATPQQKSRPAPRAKARVQRRRHANHAVPRTRATLSRSCHPSVTPARCRRSPRHAAGTHNKHMQHVSLDQRCMPVRKKKQQPPPPPPPPPCSACPLARPSSTKHEQRSQRLAAARTATAKQGGWGHACRTRAAPACRDDVIRTPSTRQLEK